MNLRIRGIYRLLGLSMLWASVLLPTAGAAENPNLAKAVFAGGCFWCMEPVFRAREGIQNVEAGYCGGTLQSPSYEQVCGGNTGHVEAIRVTFDPRPLLG